MRRAVLLLVLGLAACGDRAVPEPAPELRVDTLRPAPGLPPAPVPDSSARPAPLPRPEAPTAFDRAAIVFDTLEPLPPRVKIQPRPNPPPPPEPPRLRPTPKPTEPPPARTAGSCDVRSTESFCFAYTGDGWSPRSATAHCAAAPESGFRRDACPTADAIATCRFRRDDAPALEIVYTYYAPYDLMLAELACPGDFETLGDE